MIKKLLIIITILLTATNCLALDKIYNHLRLGKNGLETKDYKRAVEEFTKYLEGGDILQDYALFWRAKAYKELNMNKEAVKDIQTIKELFASSPILPYTLNLEIEIENDHSKGSETHSKKKILELCKDYLKLYPKSDTIRLLYAETLEKTDELEDAKKQYKKLYLLGSTLPKDIIKRYNFQRLGPATQITRAENLIKSFKYSSAEQLMLVNIDRAKRSKLKKGTQILSKVYFVLAVSLFSQKKYKLAADYFKETGDIYSESFSLYRADYERYKKRIKQNAEILTQNGDPKADDLLLKIGLQAKNDGNFDEAVKILLSINKTPANYEEVLWGTGWTYYLKGDYDKSYETFSILYERYPNPKYLYWMGRSLEGLGKDPMPIYKQITIENNFYTLLTQYKNKTITRVQAPFDNKTLNPGAADTPAPALKITNPSLGDRHVKNEASSKELQRLNVLIILKLDPAISIEAGHILKTLVKEQDGLIAEASCLLESCGLYYKSVTLTDRIPYEENLHRIFYPIVFKETVETASNMFGISPNLIFAIMREESRFNETALSPAGAVGLMQLMPTTAMKIAKKIGSYNAIEIKDDDDILKVNNNISIGAKYLKILVEEYDSLPPAIASYNAGRLIVKSWLERGHYKSTDEFIEDIPYAETRNYVKRVLKSYFQYLRYNINNYDDGLLLTFKQAEPDPKAESPQKTGSPQKAEPAQLKSKIYDIP